MFGPAVRKEYYGTRDADLEWKDELSDEGTPDELFGALDPSRVSR